jgi:hypothetical protein
VTAIAITCPACRGTGAIREEFHAPGWIGRRTVACEAPGCVCGVVPQAALCVRAGLGWDGGVAVYRVAEIGFC